MDVINKNSQNIASNPYNIAQNIAIVYKSKKILSALKTYHQQYRDKILMC